MEALFALYVAVQLCVFPAVVTVPSIRSPETLPVYCVSPTLNEICSPFRRPPAIGVAPERARDHLKFLGQRQVVRAQAPRARHSARE